MPNVLQNRYISFSKVKGVLIFFCKLALSFVQSSLQLLVSEMTETIKRSNYCNIKLLSFTLKLMSVYVELGFTVELTSNAPTAHYRAIEDIVTMS